MKFGIDVHYINYVKFQIFNINFWEVKDRVPGQNCRTENKFTDRINSSIRQIFRYTKSNYGMKNDFHKIQVSK